MVINLLGDSLDTFIKKNGRFSLKYTLHVGIQILKLLKIIHEQKLIHRDIKPTNFLVTKDLQIKIADFGICKILETDIIQKSQENLQYIQDIHATSNVGTLYYMAPELVVKQKITHYSASVDIYSFGSVMYEIFEGNKIFDFCENREEFIGILSKHYRPRFHKTLPFIKKIILDCLSHNPLKRPTALGVLKYFQYHRKKKWWLKFRF
jgi:serine/threonine protein kinase